MPSPSTSAPPRRTRRGPCAARVLAGSVATVPAVSPDPRSTARRTTDPRRTRPSRTHRPMWTVRSTRSPDGWLAVGAPAGTDRVPAPRARDGGADVPVPDEGRADEPGALEPAAGSDRPGAGAAAAPGAPGTPGPTSAAARAGAASGGFRLRRRRRRRGAVAAPAPRAARSPAAPRPRTTSPRPSPVPGCSRPPRASCRTRTRPGTRASTTSRRWSAGSVRTGRTRAPR